MTLPLLIPPPPHPCSGVCATCQGTLDKALSEADHQVLLDALKKVVLSEGLGFSPELISNTSQLHQLVSSATTPYRVIVDGLNVSRMASANFNVRQVSHWTGVRGVCHTPACIVV